MKSLQCLPKRILSFVLALALVLSGSAFVSLGNYKKAAAANYLKVPFTIRYYTNSSKTTSEELATFYLHFRVSSYMAESDDNGYGISLTKEAFYIDESCRTIAFTVQDAVNARFKTSFEISGVVQEGTAVAYPSGLLHFNQFDDSIEMATVNTPVVLYGTLSSRITLDNQSATTAGTGSITTNHNASIPNIEVPQKTGYAFGGYFSGTNGSGTQYISSNGTPLAAFTNASTRLTHKESTLYAKWTANKYTVTLDNQSATSAGSAGVTAAYGSAMPSITVPRRTGYTFGGYYTGTNGSGTQYYTSSGASARPWDKTSPATLYAKWTANQYTVTLDNQSATTAGTAGVTASYGSAMPSITVPAKTGYTFGGYYTGKNGSGTQYYTSSGASSRAWDKNAATILYACWNVNTYNVTVIDRCGTSILDTREFACSYGETASAAEMLGSSKTIGAYHSDYRLSSCGSATVTGNCTIYRDFVSYKDCGLNGSVISDDGKTLVSAGADVTNAVIPSSVTNIADNAFKNCTSLRKVTIPNNSVTSIGKNAFSGCSNLTEISLPYSVAKIGVGAFAGCINLDSVIIRNPGCVIGDSNTTIPGNTEIHAFQGSTGIDFAKNYFRNIEMITDIGNDFFANEASLVNFDIPKNVTRIGNNAFKNCTNLETVTLGNVRTIGDNAFINTQISSVTIPDDTKTIGKNAFSDCTLLEAVIFEDGSRLEEIGNYAFARDTSLQYGTCTTPSDSSNEVTLYLPPAVTRIGSYAFLGCSHLGQVDVTGMDTAFGADVFDHETVVGVYAGSDAFTYADANSYQIALWSGYETNRAAETAENQYKDNRNIYSAGFGTYQTEIPAGAFSGCEKLTDVVYSRELVKIGTQAFHNCTSLKSCQSADETITDWGLSYIGDGAFSGCSSLKQLNLYNPNCEIVQTDAEGEDFLSAITIPSTVKVNAWSKSTAYDYCNKYGLTRNPVGASYQIIFNKNGGYKGTDKIYAYNGMDWPAVDVPERTGYGFSGYSYNGVGYYDGEGSVKLAGEAINLNHDMMESGAPVAEWTANLYKISFDANGGGGTMQEMDMTYDVPDNLPGNAFTRAGYTFAGWNTKADGTGTPYREGQIVSSLTSEADGTVKLYAQWNPVRYTVVFDANGGSGDVPSGLEAVYGTEYAIGTEAPEKEEHTFTGWNTKADGTGTHYDAGGAVKNLTTVSGAAVTLYAEYAAIPYTIRYELDGGSFSGENRNPESYTANDTVSLENPAKKGYTFAGWTGTGIEGVSREVKIPKGSRGDRSYTAHWTLDTYSIRYELDGGSLSGNGGLENPQTYTVHTEDFELCIPEKTGYTFLGWQESHDNEPAVYYKVSRGSTGDLLFTAKWRAKTYQVTLNTNGGTFDTPSDNVSSYIYGVGAKLPGHLTQEGFHFLGWSETNGGSASVTEILPDDTGDKTYYAVWEEDGNSKCTIHYMDGTEELGADAIYDYNKKRMVIGCKETPGIMTLPAAAKKGFTFAGWYENANFTGEKVNVFVYEGEEDDSQEGEKYFYAKWAVNTYDIFYELDGGTSSSELAAYYVYGKGRKLAEDVTKEGYTFGGWYENPDCQGEPLAEIFSDSTGAKTLYARWEPKTYAIRYYLNEGGFGSPAADTYTYGRGMTLPTDVTRNGCQFEGWYGNKNYTGSPVISISKSEQGDRTYFAKWSPRTYHITYVLDGGRINDTDYVTSYVYNTSATLPSDVAKDGCRFDGWYDNPDFEGKAVAGITSVTYGNRTYYAKYVKVPGAGGDASAGASTADHTDSGNNGTDRTDTGAASVYTTTVMGGVTYQITDPAKNAVTISRTASSDDTSVTIPAKVKIKGVSYKVTRIEDKAFRNWKNLKTVVIGKNVERIGKKVFQGDGKLKKITIKSKKLASVGGKTLKGVNKKLKIYVPKDTAKKYKKLFQGKGQKTVKVVVKK